MARPPGVVLETLLTSRSSSRVRSTIGLHAGPCRRAPVALRELDDENLILVRRPARLGSTRTCSRCARLRDAAGVVAEVERMMTSLNLVAAGAGVTVVPASMQGAHPHAIAYRRSAGTSGSMRR